jgi:hypothetical protein
MLNYKEGDIFWSHEDNKSEDLLGESPEEACLLWLKYGAHTDEHDMNYFGEESIQETVETPHKIFEYIVVTLRTQEDLDDFLEDDDYGRHYKLGDLAYRRASCKIVCCQLNITVNGEKQP